MKNNKDMPEQLKGLWPAMFTPVDKNGKLQVTELEKLVELLIAQEVDGLYLLGSTGQGFLFNEAERMQIAELSLQIVNKRLPVMVQVGALNTEESVRLARHASQAGADAISSVGPIYYGATDNMAFEHYRRIAAATDLPFFPYQIGTAVSFPLIDRLMQVDNIAGMKLTTQNLLEISKIHQVAGSRFQLFSGADELMCHAALCGTAGAIGTTYNLLGEACKGIREEFLNGQVQQGQAFMLGLQDMINEVIPNIWAFFRRAMVLKHKIDIGDPKPPLLAAPLKWSDEEILGMVNRLESLARTKDLVSAQN